MRIDFTVTIVMAATLLAAGCTSLRSGRTALACPDCRAVFERDNVGYEDGYAFPEVNVRHECPGCQGLLSTLFTEGRWGHKCSRCEGAPYSCVVYGR